MIKKQHGFGAVEIILIIVLIGLAGVGAWYVWQANTTKTSQTTPPVITAPAPATKSYELNGLTFAYPANWTLTPPNSSQSTSTTLTSPNFGDNTGQRITIDGQLFLTAPLTADNFQTKQIDAYPNSYSDYKELTIDGKKAIQYYAGDSRTTLFFMADGRIIGFTLDTFPNRAAASDAYDAVVASVRY